MGILTDQNTTIVVQGITGREASILVKDSLDYGARILAGVTPGKGGQHVSGVRVYDSVRRAVQEHGVNASVISVPPLAVRDAAFEALESGIKLIVILTERVPRQDIVQILTSAEEEGARVIGPNSLGLLTPGVTKVGGLGGSVNNTRRSFTSGTVGVISRSGGMTCEVANLLTQNGIGQSTCVSIGGDPIVGLNFTELFRFFQDDPETEAVTIFCEPGGSMEEHFAAYYAAREHPKPVVAFVAGKFVDQMPGTRFGHAAVIVEGVRGSAQRKVEVMRKAGIHVADKLSEIPRLVKTVLNHGNVH